ncbi:hypothetical protein B0H12DRAFT_1119480 [Mycena haematopus]|nr:hypothetical protein B0H12DRAFT_1119480 [Mycena haematopus]
MNPPIAESPNVHSQKMLAYSLVKLAQPEQTTYNVKFARKFTQRTIRCRQFPITVLGAYAFTDYRSQGQTIPYVLVDVASPPSGTLSLFNLCVALSRIQAGRQSVFDDKLFM